MEPKYKDILKRLGYDQLVCDIFANWENVKDEILVSERKTGTGNGTIHVFLGAADSDLRKEFPNYYMAVEAGEDTAIHAVPVKHYFVASNLISMLGYVSQYHFHKQESFENEIKDILRLIDSNSSNGLLETSSLFKLSTGSNKLRPYFKQFDSNGVFTKLVRKLLLPNSAYKIYLLKNSSTNQYSAFWLIGFNDLSNFEANSNADLIKSQKTTNQEFNTQQVIYYGAPGTGKSFKVENREGESEEDRIRTTFHPDTDYSSFVGCYKPVPKEDNSDKITYRFIGQCFTKAYIEAWKRYVAPQDGQNRNFTLVIEEINRGNCAQIFGDIFQLLDRNGDGFSQYTISPDVDLTNFLAEQFDKIKEQMVEQGFEKIADGTEMKLPPNLSIIATMNTSDQSLFPIDSAFKRRWDWEYIPIQYSPIDDVTKETIANKINIKGTTYDWGEFIKAVNERIYQLTKSEDKELGYFFVRPDDGIYITMQRFVSKVIFYLWSDIYKDYAGRENSIFKFSEDSNGKNKIDHSFNSFFNEKEINVKLVKMFIEQFVGTDNAADAKMKYKVNGDAPVGGRRIAVEAMKKYVEKFSQQTPQQVLEQWNTLGISVSHFVETEDVFQSQTDTPRSELITWGENNKIYVTTNGWVYNTNEQYKVSTIKQLVEAINSKEDWGITVEIVNNENRC